VNEETIVIKIGVLQIPAFFFFFFFFFFFIFFFFFFSTHQFHHRITIGEKRKIVIINQEIKIKIKVHL